MKNPLFKMKSVIKGRYKANVVAGAGSGAETFCKSEPERKQKVSAPQHCILETLLNSISSILCKAQFSYTLLRFLEPFRATTLKMRAQNFHKINSDKFADE
jgi:hypothetical protein